MEIFCLVQPDPVRIHPLGNHRLSGAKQQEFLHCTASGTADDIGMQHIYMHRSRRSVTSAGNFIHNRRHLHSYSRDLVYCMAQKIQVVSNPIMPPIHEARHQMVVNGANEFQIR